MPRINPARLFLCHFHRNLRLAIHSGRVAVTEGGVRALLCAVAVLGIGLAPALALTGTTTTLTATSGGTAVSSGGTITSPAQLKLTATVLAGATPVTGGTVNFCVSGALVCSDVNFLGTAQLTSAGTASYSFVPAIGVHGYVAIFAGTTTYATSNSPAFSLSVAGGYLATSTLSSTLTSSNPNVYTLTDTVVGYVHAYPLGTVSFEDTSNANQVLGTATLTSGTDSFSLSAKPTVNTTTNYTRFVTVGDVNGDGIPDIITSLFYGPPGPGVQVFLGNGDGTFNAGTVYTVSSTFGPQFVALGDFNNDGCSDILAEAFDTNQMALYLNTKASGACTGTFAAATYFSGPGGAYALNGPGGLGVGDFNKDGNLDFIVNNDGPGGSTGTDSVVFFGDGAGGFAAATPVQLAPGGTIVPEYTAVADFNADGFLDLAIANVGTDTFNVYLNNGSGGFTLAHTYATPVANTIIKAADLNQDGKIDLAISSGQTSTPITVWKGNGDGSFTQQTSPTVGSVSIASFSAADFNGDGIPDLIYDTSAPAATGSIYVILGNGDFTFQAPSTGVSTLGDDTLSLAVGDFNGDGYTDAVVGNYSSNSLAVYLAQYNATATTSLAGVSVSGAAVNPHQVEAVFPLSSPYTTSISNTVPLIASVLTDSIALTDLTAPSTIYNQTATFQATLSPYTSQGYSTNGETVAFYDGASALGTATLSNGVATYNTTTLPAGSHSLTAKYTTDGSFASATSSPAVSHTVNKASLTLAAPGVSPSGAPFGTSVTFTETVPADYTGTLVFYSGATPICTATLVGTTESCSSSALPAGTDSITAQAGTDSNYNAATSPATTDNVGSLAVGVTGASLSFPNTNVGATSAPQTATLTTYGTGNTIINSITVPNSPNGSPEYIVNLGALSGCVIGGAGNPSGSVCTFPITFAPAYPGQRPTPLIVTTNGGTFNFALYGTGIGPLAALTPGIISTIAGNGTPGETGDGGAASSAEVFPYYLLFDSAGNLYFSDPLGNVVRKISAAGTISTVIGTGVAGYNGDGIAAASAQVSDPSGLAMDGAGNLYIADSSNNRIRKIDAATGNVTTVAGNGQQGPPDSSVAASSRIDEPDGLAVDSVGDIYFTQHDDNNVWRVDATSGVLSLAAGNGNAGFSGDGGPATSAELYYPTHIALDSAGDLFISDNYNYRIREVSATTGVITTVAGNGTEGHSGDGGLAASAELGFPAGLRFDPAGNLYITESQTNEIREVNMTTGIIGTVAGYGVIGYAGDNGAATGAQLYYPNDVALDSLGNLYISDTFNHRIRKVTVNQSALTFPTPTPAGQFDTTDDPLFVTLSNIGNSSLTLASATNPSIPAGFALDAANTCAASDTLAEGSACLLKIDFDPTAAGTITGTAIVTDNSASSTQTVALSGTASAALAAATTTTLTSSGSPSTYGQSVTFTATVGSSSGTPGGTVQFSVDGTNAGSPVTLSGGTATYATSTLTAGSHTIAATYLPGANPYSTSNGSITQIVNKTTPTLTWTNPAPITYGTALSATQLDATATVPGTFVYSPAAGTVLAAGTQTLSVTFTPTDTTDYGNATATVTLVVNKTAPTLTWANPAPITYGTALSATQLDATATVPGTFVYSPAAGTVLAAGTQTLSVTFTPTDTTDYGNATATVTLVVNKTTPTLTWTNPAPITYGTALSATQLDATATVPGTFVYSPAAGTVLAAGTQTLSVTFTPTDTTDYGNATATVTLVVNKTTPTLTWTNPAPITYGTALSATQLDATATVPGTFVYSPAAGTVLAAGTQTLSVTFTPTDTTDYGNATATVTLVVNKTTPTLTWTNPAPITYGTALSATQLDATATVPGTFVYSPAAGTVLAAGTQTLSVTFTPTDTTDYGNATATVTLVVNKTTPTLTWTNPAPITYGTALSATQLDATATVPGTFVYSPAAGTVLAAGTQTLSVTFTPTDTTDYGNATATVTLVVNKAALGEDGYTLTWTTPAPITYGTALSSTQLDAIASIPGTYVYTPAPGTVLGAGTQTLSVTFTPTDSTDYSNATATVTLVVNKASLGQDGYTLNWPTPQPILYGTALSSTQLDAVASLPGTYTYTPAPGSVPVAGTETLTVTFTPADAADYNTATATVSLKTEDFAIAAATTTQTVNPGNSVSYTLTLAGVSGAFSQAITLSATGLPAGATVSFSPASLTPGSAEATTTMTITTSATVASLSDRSSAIRYGLLLLPLLGLRRFRRTLRALPKSATWIFAVLLTLGTLSMMMGCGANVVAGKGGYFPGAPHSNAITVTAISGTLQHSASVTLTLE